MEIKESVVCVCVRSKGRDWEVYPEYEWMAARSRGAEGQSFIASPLCLHVITIRDGGIVTVVHFLQEGVIGTTTEAKDLALVWALKVQLAELSTIVGETS